MSSSEAVREAGRYRKVYPRIWRHARFRALKPAARELALYILSGPQTNAIGLFSFSMGAAAEDLGLGLETVVERFGNVREAFGWQYDSDARVMYIPSWWRWNRPENPNVLRGNLKHLSEIPSTRLAELFAVNVRTLPETLHETFIECCRERLGEPVSNQEQEQDQDQDQKQEAGAGARPARASASVSSLSPLTSVLKSGSDEALLPIAREVLALTSGPLEHLADTLLNIKPRTLACNRNAALHAMNLALAERRQRSAAR